MNINICIPVYNEEENLPTFIQDLNKFIKDNETNSSENNDDRDELYNDALIKVDEIAGAYSTSNPHPHPEFQ